MSAPATGYKFGRKNQWRRTVWNRIAERLDVPAREAIVLYLAGPDDLDAREAVRRGFQQRNLIAIDRDPEIVKDLRKGGRLAVTADFLSVMFAWKYTRPVHVIFGDFCCGIDDRFLGRLHLACRNPAFRSAAFAFNFMRGREVKSDRIAAIRELMEDEGYSTKHRGVIYLYFHLFNMSVLGEPFDGQFTSDQRKLWDFYRRRVVADFLSYKSTSGQVFDSAVWRDPLPRADPVRARALQAICTRNAPARTASTARRIAATLAHRTMRGAT